MKDTGIFALTLLATMAVGAAASAQSKPTHDPNTDKAFTRLSVDGGKAFEDLRRVRLAIFEGDTNAAKTYIHDAKAEITKAKTDNTALMKAESDLKTPPDAQKTASGKTPNTTPTDWIPVDGTLTLDEDYSATPQKGQGVAAANEKLAKGQAKEAAEALKLAQINAVFVTELAPMDQTVTGIDKAAELIDTGKFYQANQELKSVEDGVRFDTIDVSTLPKKTPNDRTTTTAPQSSGGSGSGK